MKYHRSFLAMSVMAIGWSVAPALAQVDTPGGQRGDDSYPSNEIEQIIVTAQRRAENLQDVPIAVTSVTASQLQASGIASSLDLAVATPSLQVNDSIGYFTPRLRGIGSTATGPGIEGAVATYIDNVYIGSAPASIFSFNAVDHVEILMGPQGTLFGRNATGGLINVITKDPSHDASVEVHAGYGNFQTESIDVYMTGGLSDTVAADFSVLESHQGEGYGRNLATGGEAARTARDLDVRGKLLWEPTAGTSVRLSVDYENTLGSDPSVRDLLSTPPLFGPGGGSNPWNINNNYPDRYSFDGGGINLRLDQDLSFAKLLSISAYRESFHETAFDFDVSPTPALAITQSQFDRQFSQEVQLQSEPASSVKWVTGVYYFNADSEYPPYNPLALYIQSALQAPTSPLFPVAQVNTMGTQTTQSYAGFGQATAPVGFNSNLTVGFRYTEDKRAIVDPAQQTILIGGTALPVTSFPNEHKNFDAPTWRISLDHNFTPNILAYISDNRGFKSGGFNPGTPGEPPYLQERLDAYEVGLKTTLLDRRLRFNSAAFYYDYSNIQVPFITSAGGLGVANGPKAEVWGLEAEGDAALSSAFHLTYGVTYLHDRFGNFPDAIFYTPTGVGGNVVSLGQADGNRLPLTSDFASSLGANYRVDLGNRSGLVLETDWSHNNGFYTDTDNLRRQPAYNIVNASLSYLMDSGRYSVKFWGKNLADNAVIVEQTSAAYASYVSYAPPRTYGVTFGAKF
jgi:iron complex outermembrane recepter protein